MEIAAWFHKVFGDRYFIEIQNNGLEIQQLAMQGAVEVATRMGLPLVATSDAHYVNREDAEAQDVLLCINTGKFRTDKQRMRMEGDQFYPAQRRGDARGAGRQVCRGAARKASRSPTRSTSSWTWASGTFPPTRCRPKRPPRIILRELCLRGLKERYADDAERLAGGELARGRDWSGSISNCR